MKTYSNWPTYPQLYVDGELIGGLDILKEMHAAGDLQSVLPKKQVGDCVVLDWLKQPISCTK